MKVYLKQFGIWLGGALLLVWILPFFDIYIPFLNIFAIIAGTITSAVMVHKSINKRISFGKSIASVAIILTIFLILGIIMNIIEWGASDLSYMLPFFLTSFLTELFLGATILLGVGVWYMFEKAGKPGWGVLIPIYNLILMCEIAKKPTWWVFMFFIPIANIVFAVMLMDGLSKAFNRDTGFTVGLVFLSQIFMAILGYGDAIYLDGSDQLAKNDNSNSDLLDN